MIKEESSNSLNSKDSTNKLNSMFQTIKKTNINKQYKSEEAFGFLKFLYQETEEQEEPEINQIIEYNYNKGIIILPITIKYNNFNRQSRRIYRNSPVQFSIFCS